MLNSNSYGAKIQATTVIVFYTACDNTTYGDNCSSECGKCKDGAPCNPATGVCPDGCDAGYLGELCLTRMLQYMQIDL